LEQENASMPTYIMPESESATDTGDSSLEVFFAPERVAIFGATEAPESAGRAVMTNMIRHQCGATLFPISPGQKGVLGIEAYPSLEAVPLPVDLAIVATPAPAVPGVIRKCVAAGVKGAIILSAGFRECGPAGTELEQQIVAELRRGHLRVLGPNSLGVACPHTGINATFATAMVPRGSVGFLSQSGAILSALLSPDLPEPVGCSAFISLGSMLDLDWTGWLQYLGEDPQTEIIGIYAEALGDVRSFIRAVCKVTPHKPVILVKGRRAEATARLAPTERLAEREDVLDDLFRRAGVLRVDTIPDLIRVAAILATQRVSRGSRVTIVSNARAPAVLATGALLAEGSELAVLTPATNVALDALLPGRNHQNPIDLGDDASTERFARAAAIAARDSNSDALLLLLSPHATIDPLRTAELVSRLAPDCEKPILASWLWGAATPTTLRVLNQAGIPTFTGPEEAVHVIAYLWRHTENLGGLHEDSTVAGLVSRAGPGLARPAAPPVVAVQQAHVSPAGRIVQAARSSGRALLTGAEAQQLLAAYSLPAAETQVASDHEAAVELATLLGYPVVLSPFAEGGGLRGDVQGVRLHAEDSHDVRRAYCSLKAIVCDHSGPEHFQGVRVQPILSPNAWTVGLHSAIDPDLGPVLRFIAGSPWAATTSGHVIAFPPLTSARVRQLFGRPPLGTTLQALYGSGMVDLAALEQFLVNFSRLVVDQRWIKEIRIELLLAWRERLLALDPLVFLHGPDVREEQLPEFVLHHDAPHRVIAESPERHFKLPLGLLMSESDFESEGEPPPRQE
jgi:acetyltransferase